MLVQCPLSGVQYRLTTLQGTSVKSLHPITAMQLTELNELRIPSQYLSAHLYLCGYLHKLNELGLIKYGNIPISRCFSHQWILQQAGNLVRIANWVSLNPAHNVVQRLPAFRLSADTSALELQEWAAECCTIIDTESTAWARKKEIAKVQRLLSAQYPNQRGDYFDAAEDRELADQKARKTPAITRGRYLLKWIHESFGSSSIISVQQFSQLKSVLKRPADYPYGVLQQVKAFTLDFGLEKTIEQKNEKDTVLASLDSAMVKKVGVAALLGNGIASGVKKSDGPRAVSAYTILSDIPTSPAVAESKPAETIAVPTVEPRPQDYPSRLAYAVASRKYREAKAQGRLGQQ